MFTMKLNAHHEAQCDDDLSTIFRTSQCVWNRRNFPLRLSRHDRRRTPPDRFQVVASRATNGRCSHPLKRPRETHPRAGSPGAVSLRWTVSRGNPISASCGDDHGLVSLQHQPNIRRSNVASGADQWGADHRDRRADS